MHIGSKLKLLRNEKDYTLKELAERTDLSISFISDIENGRRNPSLENLVKLAGALGVPADILLSDEQRLTKTKTIAAHKTDGYNDNLTPEEQAAVRAFIDTYRKQFKKNKDE